LYEKKNNYTLSLAEKKKERERDEGNSKRLCFPENIYIFFSPLTPAITYNKMHNIIYIILYIKKGNDNIYINDKYIPAKKNKHTRELPPI
jgi:hypothetical protein